MPAVPVARMSIHILWVASCIVAAPTSTDFLAKADNSRRNGPTCITNWCTSYGATTNEDLPKNCIRRPPLHKIKRRDSFWVLRWLGQCRCDVFACQDSDARRIGL